MLDGAHETVDLLAYVRTHGLFRIWSGPFQPPGTRTTYLYVVYCGDSFEAIAILGLIGRLARPAQGSPEPKSEKQMGQTNLAKQARAAYSICGVNGGHEWQWRRKRDRGISLVIHYAVGAQ